ncbi:5022_t:CDS:2, partial [Funneliformis mosseae]
KAVRNDYLQQSTMPDNLLLSETAYFGSLFNVETNELSLPGLIKRLKSQLYHNTLLNKLRILLHLYNNTSRLEFNGEESIEIQNKVQYEVSTLMKYFLEKVLDTIAYCLQRDLIVNGPGFKGVCEKGHLWERCSITLNILSNKFIKSCSICKRKSFDITNANQIISSDESFMKSKFFKAILVMIVFAVSNLEYPEHSDMIDFAVSNLEYPDHSDLKEL